MLRQIHSLPGLLAALLISALAITGAILAVEPVMDRTMDTPVVHGQMTVAAFAEAMQARHPEVDKIVRAPSGAIVVSYFDEGKASANRVDPVTMAVLGPHAPSPFLRFITNLHRSFLLGDGGRLAAGLGALAMLVLSVSGVMMLAARLGGWRALFRPVRGSLVQRWHAELGRLAVLVLLLSAVTGCYMSLTTFGFLPENSADKVATIAGNGEPRLAVGAISALQGIDLADLRELTFPYASDLTDVYTLTTAAGVSQIDAAAGVQLAFEPHALTRRISETIYMLHTGQGLWPLAVLLGLAALCVPVFTVTGGLIWWQRQRGKIRIPDNAGQNSADTILLVGSEGNTTWGFAKTLHAAMTASGHRVHAAPMNALAAAYPKAERMLLLAATYGDGTAPASANAFLAKIGKTSTPVPFAVLGFGDRSFPKFCGFAEEVAATLKANGWPRLLETHHIDRQSVQEFARWGERLGAVIGEPLALAHVAARPATTSLQLVERIDYGAQVQAPTRVLTFAAGTRRSFWQRLLPSRLPRFEPGDLVGILPPGSDQARFYSLASASRDGLLEICVRKQPGGLCSGFLHDLDPGETIEAFIRPNPGFRPKAGKAPLILIGAGAGIGPLMGFIRHNDPRRPVHLYWGGRSPTSDFLYEEELSGHLASHRLAHLATAFSRVPGGGYVQDRLAKDAGEILALIRAGAQILVCGGRDMASGVTHALEEILAPAGLSLAGLKAGGLYVEDVY